MKRILPLVLLLSAAVLSRGQVDPPTGQPYRISVSVPAEMPGQGDITNINVTLHYRQGGTHYLRESAFSFVLLDANGDQIRQGLLPSQIDRGLTLEGTDPVYSPYLGIDTQNKLPLTKGARYQLVVIFNTDIRSPRMINVKSFKIAE